MLQKASRLSLAQFDQPATHDLIERAEGDHGFRVAAVWNRLLWAVQMLLRTGSAAVIIAAAAPTLALLACAAAIPMAWANLRQGQRLFALKRSQAPQRRMTQYLAGLMSDRHAATELRAYQLLPFFLERWRTLFHRQRDEQMQTHWRSAREGLLAELAGASLYAIHSSQNSLRVVNEAQRAD